MSYNKFPWVNTHGFNLDWVIQKVTEASNKVDDLTEEIENISDTYETKENITTSRKLSKTGDFTGTWFGNTFTKIFGKVDSNNDKIDYLTNQFYNGQTGYVIDGGFFEETLINKNYNGGVF